MTTARLRNRVRAMASGMAMAFLAALTMGAVLGAGPWTAPAGAQMFSDGYKFLKAVRDRDAEAVTQALNEPGSIIINTRDISTGETGLHIVTRQRDLTWLRFLIQRGANPDIADKNGTTPLQIAVSMGFVEGAQALLKAGASTETSDASGETPLIAAVHRRDIPMIRLLLEHGASPDRPDNSGRSARDYAELMKANDQILAEFARADEKRAAGAGQDQRSDYGPSL